MLTTARLNGYAQSQGFDSESERLAMILSVPKYKQEDLEQWMDECGSKAGLLAILTRKRTVRQENEE